MQLHNINIFLTCVDLMCLCRKTLKAVSEANPILCVKGTVRISYYIV